QKVSQVARYGGEYAEIVLIGDTYDDAYASAMACAQEGGMQFIHPFDDDRIIAGNGTIGKEIMEKIDGRIDYIFLTVGGGGLASGVGSYVKSISPATRIIGVEPEGAPAMHSAL